jgi:RHS repeat-associated protein
VEVQYHYDLEDPERYVSKNNRLVYYETLDTEPDPPVVAATTWYYYSILGNPTWIVTKQAGSDDYSAIRFGYARNGETVTLVLGETWTWDGESGCETSQTYDITFAREFRYDSGRARYLDRELDPEDLEGGVYTALSETWSDYDGDEIYGDYTVDGMGADTDLRSFEPGVGTVDPWENAGDDSMTYSHANHLGTLRQTTGTGGMSLRVFTGFGEPVTSQGDRYGFVGAWGYQADAYVPHFHVGARYYDPSAGRFLQRDPIGLAGGFNIYSYMQAQSTVGVDPEGQVLWVPIVIGVIIFIDVFREPAEAPSMDDTRADFERRRREREREALWEAAGEFIPIAVLCRAAKRGAGKIGPSPNPDPFISPFPPTPRGPFFGGGQTWPGGGVWY